MPTVTYVNFFLNLLQALAASGKLGKLKVDDLKPYLKANGLKVTGKKDDLIQRITEHVQSQR